MASAGGHVMPSSITASYDHANFNIVRLGVNHRF